MKKEDIFKFEPINLTQIILYIVTLFAVIFLFRSQLNSFFESLSHRPITVKMDGTQTSIELDAPVDPKFFTTSISNPIVTEQNLENWKAILDEPRNVRESRKGGFSQLNRDMESLSEDVIGVMNYMVNDASMNYFEDSNMLKYLSIASEKIRYLAFYDHQQFVAYIKIEKVIKGLASEDDEFRDFGQKLKQNNWQFFPGLVKADKAFSYTPTIKELFERLENSGLTEVPLLKDGQLEAILNYETVSSALYKQTQDNQEIGTHV